MSRGSAGKQHPMSNFAMHTIGMYSLHHAFRLPLERMVTLLGSMQSPRCIPCEQRLRICQSATVLSHQADQ